MKFDWRSRVLAGFQWVRSKVKAFDGHHAATLSMRWARPVFFVLIVVMLFVGWFYPASIQTYFESLSAAPDWFADILTVLILGLAVEKGISRPIENVAMAARSKKRKEQARSDIHDPSGYNGDDDERL